jgi:hypothetical protein
MTGRQWFLRRAEAAYRVRKYRAEQLREHLLVRHELSSVEMDLEALRLMHRQRHR